MPRVNRPAGAPPPATTSPEQSYTISAGDTLSKIATRLGVSVQALVDANKARYPSLATNPNAISVGWKLNVPPGGQAPAEATWKPKSNDQIVLVGMNENSSIEVDLLRSRGAKVNYIKDSGVDDQLAIGGKTYDLKTLEGATAFALTLGLPAEQTQAIATVIAEAGTDARDELAQIAQAWAPAEKGLPIPARMVFSGHHVGSTIWGDDNGSLRWTSIGALATAMPKAARSVEDLHIAACYSGGLASMEKFRAIFPNAKTIWAYDGSAPGGASGAIAHLRRWEQATQGTRADLDRKIAEGTRKGENVAVWSAEHGYLGKEPPKSLESVRADYTQRAQDFGYYFSGERPVENPQTGPLRELYNYTQRLLQHPELPASERPTLEAQRDRTIRLLFYSTSIAPKFARAHGATIEQGFRALELEVPDFAKLTRAEAMAKISEFEAKVAATSNPPSEAVSLQALLVQGLKSLEPTFIPETWI